MMEDEGLKEEVKEISSIEEALQASRRGHRECFRPCSSNLGCIRQSNLTPTVYLHMGPLREGYSQGSKKNQPGFACKMCRYFFSEEILMQGHVARKHFLRIVSLEEGNTLDDENSPCISQNHSSLLYCSCS
ncbi:hypothetical protein RvY_17999 [Ramazzottius varieornatus]|uniref:C2H2-type domain-containing protein n=1 Tax=Ramazzottius varieornatus TaxID=947166 RepID=A0A1D1W625_RAMVA|nr:hypothetical protein RvY_17999 [Ramazzottius varieornatus]